VLQRKLSQLDVVTREEFDVQTQVLIKTRAQLSLLENKIAELEARLQQQNTTPELENNQENTATGEA